MSLGKILKSYPRISELSPKSWLHSSNSALSMLVTVYICMTYLLKRWQWCWWHRYVGDGLYLYDLLVKTVTVMLVTSLCWWLYDGDWFEMLMAESLCWRLFSLCWWFCWSPTSQTCHQRGVGCSWQIGSWPAHVRLLFTVNNTFGLQYPSPTSMWPLKLSLL